MFQPAEDDMSDAERVYVVQQFKQQQTQLAFMRRVYGVVTAMLSLTCLLAWAMRSNFPLLNFVVRGAPLISLVTLGSVLWLSFSRTARQGPLGLALLALFTLGQGSMVGAATAFFPADLVLRAATTTAVATGGLTVYAFRTKRDFTRWGGMLSAGLGGLLVLMLMQFLFGASSLVRMAQSYFTALLFSGYLLYNTQLMMGGDKSRQVRPDEWLLAAVSIYTDVINLFMAILEIMNSQEQRR